MTAIETSRPICAAPPVSVSVPNAAAACGISERQMWRVIKSGDITTRKMGKRTLILYVDLQDYIYALPVAS